jgi:hypothetical protein
MSIDRNDAERIASDLVAEIAAEWTDTPTARCIQETNSFIFEFTLAPAEIVEHAHVVRRPASTSIFRFNPLAEATEIVLSCSRQLNQSVGESLIREDIIRDNAKPRIVQMLISAPDVFTDATWIARLVGHTLCGLEVMDMTGRADLARGLRNSALDLIQNKLKRRFGRVSTKRNPKINRLALGKALGTFYGQYKQSGKVPSQRQFAKALGVTPKAWRTFLATHHMDKHEVTIKQWYQFTLAKDSEPKKDQGLSTPEKVPGD